MVSRPVLLSPILLLLAAVVSAQQHDVVVYGGTAGGAIAAVQAARTGRSALLVEPTGHVGGMTVSGLGATDIGNKAAIGGLAREFYRRLRRHYDDDKAWFAETRAEFTGRGHQPGDDAAWTFEPKIAERVLDTMLRDAGVTVVLHERLDLNAGVDKDGARIVAIRTTSGRRFAGRVFVDASYEGDLLAGAGVRSTVGREANAAFGETLNGVQRARAVHHQFIVRVDPFVVPGDPASGPLPGIEAQPPPADGSADRAVQAYCFRLCTTDDPDNRRPWTKPNGYDPRDYELLLRNFEAGDHRLPWNPVWMPNRKTDTNNNFAVSTDFIGQNWNYAEADWGQRDAIVAAHARYQRGLLWTLANDPRVPDAVRAHFQRFGLAADEFTDNGNWPYQLYVREARRMVSDVVMTERHCRGELVAGDPVGMGAYGMDSHHVRRYVTEDGAVRNEGDVQVGGFAPYGISYRALRPRREECTNLLVPVCLSATHIAYGSIRMEPVFMALGQSAATAACLAIENDCAVQDVAYDALRERLLADGQRLVWGPPAPVGKPLGSLEGLVVDDEKAVFEGAWVASTSVAPFVGAGYRHDDNTDKGRARVTFAVRVPEDGRYEVRLAYSAHPNRATRVPVGVRAADGLHRATVDQRQPPPIDGGWISLGVFAFSAGTEAAVTIDNAATDGYVIADAVQWLRR